MLACLIMMSQLVFHGTIVANPTLPDGASHGGMNRTAEARKGHDPSSCTPDVYTTKRLNTVKKTVADKFVRTANYTEICTHTLKFFIDPALASGLSRAELEHRLTQYAAHINYIFSKQTRRRFAFNPSTDINIVYKNVGSVSYDGPMPIPEDNYEMWVYATLTDIPDYGTHGGASGVESHGEGVAFGLYWDAIHNPESLQDGSPELEQYWKQIDHITHEFEHCFGAGVGEYYHLCSEVIDTTGVDPIQSVYVTSTMTPDKVDDPYWKIHSDYWTDPLLWDIYGLAIVGSPQTLSDLFATVRFADVTAAVINRGPRLNLNTSMLETFPDLSAVKVTIKDTNNGNPVNNALVRVWSRDTDNNYTELPVQAGATNGVFQFAWFPYTSDPGSMLNYTMKLIKVQAPGYANKARWFSTYDCQAAKLLHGNLTLDIPIDLEPIVLNAADGNWLNVK